MEDDEIKDRIISSTTGIPLYKLSRGILTIEDRKLLSEARERIESMKIKIETEARVTVDSIRAKALRQAQSNNGLDFIIIDYLQLITPVGRFNSRQEAVADISRNAKLLAKNLGVPVMVLVQVNREGKEDENPIPKLHQIRESGAIAQDSDIVILLHREEALDDTIPHTLVLLEKNRSGESQKTIRCHSNLECSLFREVIKAKDIPRMGLEEQEQAMDELNLEEFDNFISDDDILNDEDLF
jgi:replicative DNA helicase